MREPTGERDAPSLCCVRLIVRLKHEPRRSAVNVWAGSITVVARSKRRKRRSEAVHSVRPLVVQYFHGLKFTHEWSLHSIISWVFRFFSYISFEREFVVFLHTFRLALKVWTHQSSWFIVITEKEYGWRSSHVTEWESCLWWMCIRKMHRDEFPSNPDKKKRDLLDLVHTDVCGPMQTRSLGGAFYFLLFIDDCTRYTWVYFLRRKSDVFE